jgi:site-specific DNA recombinase
VRTALLELAVWQEGCALLAHPERVAAEYRRRVHADRQPTHTTLTTLAAQLGTRRQGLARLIDRDTAGLLDKPAFEPRRSRLRQRIAHLEAQRPQRAEEAALYTELPRLMGRLAACAAQVPEGLAEADWNRTRELSRALGRRVEVAQDHVQGVFRIDPRPGDPSPEKKRLQLCRKCKQPCVGQHLRVFRTFGDVYSA